MEKENDKNSLPRGGNGGSVIALGQEGNAIGGRGGRGGSLGFGQGGHGGGGILKGNGTIIGGDGGDAGRSGRPALGAPSTLERTEYHTFTNIPGTTDDYGIYWPGRGGDSHTAFIEHDERQFCINVLLRLIRIWNNSIIDAIDEFNFQTEQQWWNKAVVLFPDVTRKAIDHMIYCEDIAKVNNTAPPNPYVN